MEQALQSIQNNFFLFFPLLAWVLLWKGMALWKAARQEHKKWFVVLLVVNTFGILEILYVFFFSRPKTPNAVIR